MTHLSRTLLIAASLAIAFMGAPDPAIAQTAENSCQGEDACLGNTGTVAQDTCNGRRACAGNSGNIASGSCNGLRACSNNSAQVAQELLQR